MELKNLLNNMCAKQVLKSAKVSVQTAQECSSDPSKCLVQFFFCNVRVCFACFLHNGAMFNIVHGMETVFLPLLTANTI